MGLVLEVRDEVDGIVLSWGGAKRAIVRVIDRKGEKSKVHIEAPHSVSITRHNPNEDAPRQPWEQKKPRRSHR